MNNNLGWKNNNQKEKWYNRLCPELLWTGIFIGIFTTIFTIMVITPRFDPKEPSVALEAQTAQSEVKTPSTPLILPKSGVSEAVEEYEITAYCLNTNLMANGQEVHAGAAACPAFLPFGTKITILSDKFIDNEFTCMDRMALRYRNGKYIDLWVSDCDIAMEFGRQKLLVKID
jgi:3D (Asp-Asp-Asp) domain-containing protein